MNGLDRIREDDRVTVRRGGDPGEGCVVYWMQRAQRGLDNPALEVAIAAANELERPLAVFFGLHPRYPHANERHYHFLVQGLAETKARIEDRGAVFVFRPYPEHDLIRFCEEVQASLVVGDENPLREPEGWRRSAAHRLRVPFWTVDADVIVPTKFFVREEYAARTIRPKIHRLLDRFLVPVSNARVRTPWPKGRLVPPSSPIDERRLLAELPLDRGASPVLSARGGTAAGLETLDRFVNRRLSGYDTDRNLPPVAGTSELSAYLHYGHLGPHTIATAVRNAGGPPAATEAFLEEMIVRRELAINYVCRNPHYDSLSGCHDWAKKTLAKHAGDQRPYQYDRQIFESAATHDRLWNAAQREMVLSGRMHGYLRMYWAKKILEWTKSPEEAFETAAHLNDRYQLDGRDPNGYTGIAWAIGAKHDRPWGPERPIFGLIRYMADTGCARKFSVPAYLERVAALTG